MVEEREREEKKGNQNKMKEGNSRSGVQFQYRNLFLETTLKSLTVFQMNILYKGLALLNIFYEMWLLKMGPFLKD